MRLSSNSACAAVFVAVAWVLISTGARADGEGAALIRHGLELRREHHDEEALGLFQRAYEIRPTPRARAQIGLAEQALGKWVAAESDLQAALDTDDAWIAHHRDSLEEARKFVSMHLGWLTVSCNVPATLLLDGVAIGLLPMDHPVRVVAGTVLLRVEAEGYGPVERSVSVNSTEPAGAVIALSPLPTMARRPATPAAVPTHTPTPPTTSPVGPPRRVPWAALGAAALGLAGVTVGAVFGVEALTKKAARDEHCNARRCDQKGLDLDTQARHAATTSTIGLSVGAIALLGSAWLFVRATSPSRSVDIVPVATSTSAGVGAIWVW